MDFFISILDSAIGNRDIEVAKRTAFIFADRNWILPLLHVIQAAGGVYEPNLVETAANLLGLLIRFADLFLEVHDWIVHSKGEYLGEYNYISRLKII